MAGLGKGFFEAGHISPHSKVVVLVGKDGYSTLSEELSNNTNDLRVVLFGVDELGSNDDVVLKLALQGTPVS